MCGVVAIFEYRGERRVDPEELVAIRDAMASRGPDGQGLFITDDGRMGLAHRRLSIIDLNDRASQPMRSADGKLVISFNGEIYNYRALREGLLRQGRELRTESDTEVLLHLYAEHGEGMLEHLRGMYAFVIWDARDGSLFAARDPLGIKPLYLAHEDGALRVASQVRALLEGKVSRVLEPAGLVGFLSFGSVPEPWTCYRSIRALQAGHWVRCDERGLGTPQPFANVAQTWCEGEATPGDSDYRATLLDSVRHHLVADVPVGAFLSSGIDSTALVGLMRDAGQEHITTVTVTFDQFRGRPEDEAPLAKKVAQLYGTEHHEHLVTTEDFFASVPAIIDAMDQPSVDGFNSWLVSRAAAATGLKVAVSGLGGDELFGGYPSFSQIPPLVRALAPAKRIPAAGRLWRRAVLQLAPQLEARLPLSRKTAGLVELGGSFPGAYFLKRGLFMPWELDELMPVDEVRVGLQRLDPYAYVAEHLEPEPHSSFARVAALEMSLYMRNQLLRDTDWASMAHSLEVRTPLVDRALLERLVPSLTSRKLLKGHPKRPLAKAPSQPVPRAVLARSKTGFGLPMGDWLGRPDTRLDVWRQVPALRRVGTHWSRRLAYALVADLRSS